MSEKYNIPEENSLDSMEGINGLEEIVDNDAEPFDIEKNNENKTGGELLDELLMGEEGKDYRTEDKIERERRYTGFGESIKKMIKEWHDVVKPKYVVLNETAATPFGYIFKEMWRTAYPDEELPRFYRIDPRSVDDGEEEVYDFVKERFGDLDANIIVFDEYPATGASMKNVKSALVTSTEAQFKSLVDEEVEQDEGLKRIRMEEEEFRKTRPNFKDVGAYLRAMEEFSSMDRGNGSYDEYKYKLKEKILKRLIEENPTLKPEKIFLYGGFITKGDKVHSDEYKGLSVEHPRVAIRPTDKGRGGYDRKYPKVGLRAAIKKGPERKVALENIKKLKRVGVLLGQEMNEEIEQK